MSRVFLALDRVGEVLVIAGMVCLSGTVLVSMADIAGRKTIGFSVLGIDDIVSLTVMACISLAMPLTYLREGHVAVEFLTDPLPPRLFAVTKAVTAVLVAGFVALLAWYALKQAMQQITQGDKSNTLAIPIVAFWAPLLIGMAISTLCALALAVRWTVAALGRNPAAARAPAAPR